MRFNIGDMAWMAKFGTREISATCPDCGGEGRLRVIFHDGTEVSIGCSNCSLGYDPPTGRVRIYERKPYAERVHINGMEIGPSEMRWKLGYSVNCYTVADDKDIFDNEADALIAAQKLADAADADEQARVFQKEKDTRTWAWNASYHRKEIKRAKDSISYHERKLAVAAIKAKEKAA